MCYLIGMRPVEQALDRMTLKNRRIWAHRSVIW